MYFQLLSMKFDDFSFVNVPRPEYSHQWLWNSEFRILGEIISAAIFIASIYSRKLGNYSQYRHISWLQKTIGATTSQIFFNSRLYYPALKISFHQARIPRIVFCNVYSMSHASQEPDFHCSLLLSSVDSRIVWNPPRKLCLNWDINNLQSKTSTIMWVCYFIKPVYSIMSRDKESNLKVLVKGNMYQPMLWALSPVYPT